MNVLRINSSVLTDEWGECGRKYGRRLDDECEDGTDEDSDVAGDPRDVRDVGVQSLLDDDGDATCSYHTAVITLYKHIKITTK